ncbi:hypothetical protein [Streptomyces sp. HC307]|uniref:hypothetical protein n=1 Tax=Streptomyces flavusporus TaxID=3385496 RepID=UPI003916E0B1
MGLFSKKATTAKPLSDAEFKRRLAEIEARGEAERKEIRKAVEKRGREWSFLSTGIDLDD